MPQEYYAVKFPVIIAEKNSPKHKKKKQKRYVIILSPMVSRRRLTQLVSETREVGWIPSGISG